MHEIGYSGKRKDTHEWAKLYRGTITLDVHRHYPILSYPEDVRLMPRRLLQASQNPGRWHLAESRSDLTPGEKKIRWSDLAGSTSFGKAQGTEEILFPSPTLLCLIHCVHCFRSSLTRLYYMNPTGGFRLYELLSIRKLIDLPTFARLEFHRLVDAFAARDAVNFIDFLLRAFLGVGLPDGNASKQRKDAPVFPEHLIYGGWVSLQQTDDWLLQRHLEQFLEQLGAVVGQSPCLMEFSAAERLLTWGNEPRVLPRVSIAWDKAARSVTVDWSLSADGISTEHELLIHFGYDCYAKVRLGADWTIDNTTHKSDYIPTGRKLVAEILPGDYAVIRTKCPVPVFSDALNASASGSLPLLLAVRRLSRDGESADAASCLPIRLTSPPN